MAQGNVHTRDELSDNTTLYEHHAVHDSETLMDGSGEVHVWF